MSLVERKRSHEPSPPSIPYIQEQIRSTCEDIIHFCSQKTEVTFYQVEQSLQVKISALACLFLQLFLMTFQEKFDYSIWLDKDKYYKGQLTSRTLKRFMVKCATGGVTWLAKVAAAFTRSMPVLD